MKVFQIKMTAARTNPQQIRTVRMDPEVSVSDLLNVVSVVYEYENIKSCLKDKSNSAMSGETKLGDILHVGDFMTVKYDDKNLPEIFLEVLEIFDEADNTGNKVKSIPFLERYRTVPRRMRERDFYYSVYNPESVEDFKRYLNKKLRIAFSDEIEVPDFEWTIARPWKSFLDECTVTELKNIIKENGLNINLTQRKEQLKKELISSTNSDDFFADVMQKMNISEYFRLKELCIDGTDDDEDLDKSFPVLSSYFIVANNYWYETMLASEFMRFYESWLEDGNEKEYLLKHSEETCLMAACSLYGFADRKLIEELYHIINPEAGQADDIWKRTLKCTVRDSIKLSKIDGMYYDAEILNESSSKDLYQRFILSNRHHYVPTKKEIIEIAACGIEISKNDRQALLNIMERKFQLPRLKAKLIIKELERATSNGYPTEEMFEYLRKVLNCGRKRTGLDEVVNILERAQLETRKTVLGGYTQTEFNQIIAKKRSTVHTERKIYPNAPCPCGSGKKYKNCCGRR